MGYGADLEVINQEGVGFSIGVTEAQGMDDLGGVHGNPYVLSGQPLEQYIETNDDATYASFTLAFVGIEAASAFGMVKIVMSDGAYSYELGEDTDSDSFNVEIDNDGQASIVITVGPPSTG